MADLGFEWGFLIVGDHKDWRYYVLRSNLCTPSGWDTPADVDLKETP